MAQLAGHGDCDGCNICVVPDGATMAGGRYVVDAQGVLRRVGPALTLILGGKAQ